MICTLDGQLKAVLSDRYRRLDNFDLAENVLPIPQWLEGARFESGKLTDTKCTCVEFDIAPGDIEQAGIVITNSEMRCGTLSVQPPIFRLVCRNGLIASDHALRETHVGRAVNTAESTQVFMDHTLAAHDRAFFLKVRDVVEAAVSETTFLPIAQKLQRPGEVVQWPSRLLNFAATRVRRSF